MQEIRDEQLEAERRERVRRDAHDRQVAAAIRPGVADLAFCAGSDVPVLKTQEATRGRRASDDPLNFAV